MHGPGNEKVKCLQDPLPAHWHSSPLRTLRSMYFLSVFFNVCNPMKQIKYLGLIDWQLGKISITDSHKAQEEKIVAYWGKGEGCQVLKMQPAKIPSDERSQLKLSSEVTKMLSLIFLPFTYCIRNGMGGGNNYYFLTPRSTHNKRLLCFFYFWEKFLFKREMSFSAMAASSLFNIPSRIK